MFSWDFMVSIGPPCKVCGRFWFAFVSSLVLYSSSSVFLGLDGGLLPDGPLALDLLGLSRLSDDNWES